MIEDTPIPEPGPFDVVIGVTNAGICHSDIHAIEGTIQAKLPVTLGHEVAGKITKLGGQAKGFKEGDYVVVYFPNPCNECLRCLKGDTMNCININRRPIYGFGEDGGFSEYMLVDSRRLIHAPTEVSPEFAASLGCAGLTAQHALESAEVSPADTVVIYGAGGVGLYAIQLAKLRGATVIAVGRNSSRLELARSLGADITLSPSQDALSKEIRSQTEGRGADAVLDFVVNEESFQNSLRQLRNGGKYVIVGVSTSKLQLNAGVAVAKQTKITGSNSGTKSELSTLLELGRRGALRSVVTDTFQLTEVNDALDALRAGRIRGRATLRVSS